MAKRKNLNKDSLSYCVQCGHYFSALDLAFDSLFNPLSKTITCPVCGVENVR